MSEASAVLDNLTSVVLAPVTMGRGTTEKTGAGDAGPGSIWLKEFNR
ncbi:MULTISPECIES: hypothetical protein [unclassified Arthrobacter]